MRSIVGSSKKKEFLQHRKHLQLMIQPRLQRCKKIKRTLNCDTEREITHKDEGKTLYYSQ